MQFVNRIKQARSFPEAQKIITEAKRCGEFRNAVVYECIKKLSSRECRNVTVAYELAKQIQVNSFPSIDNVTLSYILTCASQNGDYVLAHKAFGFLKHLGDYNFYHYIASFKNADVKALPHEMKEELGSLWKKVEQFGYGGNFKVLTQLYSALSFSKEKQRLLILQVIFKPAYSTYTCGVIGTFLKYCMETNDLELAERIWVWGQSIRERENGTLRFYSLSLQYYRLITPSPDELKKFWSNVCYHGFDGRVELVTSMCHVLSFNNVELKNFIRCIISKEPDRSFHCGLLRAFLKNCTCDDRDLVEKIWNWGSQIRHNENGTFEWFYLMFHYYRVNPPQLDKLHDLWNQITSNQLVGRVELVNCMCSALSFNLMEQKNFIRNVISKAPEVSFDCSLVGVFLKHCSETNDIDLANNIWNWGKSIIDRQSGSFFHFLTSFQYFKIQQPQIDELNNLWSQVTKNGLDRRTDLVILMCTALSFSRVKQRSFILEFIAKPPDLQFTCGLVGCFLKYCMDTKDIDLANEIWKWSLSIRDRECGTFGWFYLTFQYSRLYPLPIDELKNLWGQVVSKQLDRKVELITSMYSTLSFHPLEQKNFIVSIISKEPESTFDLGILGGFLKHCSEQRNLELAQRIWAWGLEIRTREKGKLDLCKVTVLYISICGGSGDVSLLENLWEEAKRFSVNGYIEVKGALITALASNGAVDLALELFNETPIQCIDDKMLCSTLTVLSHAGRDVEALNLLRIFQKENPNIVSGMSYTPVIDAFSRNGNFEAALSLIEEGKLYGIEPCAVTWTSILGPCRYHKNLPVALKAFKELKKVKHEKVDVTSAYVLLADVYKSCGDEVTANELHKERIDKGLFKERGGVQLTLSDNEVLSFHVNEIPPQLPKEIIYHELDNWISTLERMDSTTTESADCSHSEMLALA